VSLKLGLAAVQLVISWMGEEYVVDLEIKCLVS